MGGGGWPTQSIARSELPGPCANDDGWGIKHRRQRQAPRPGFIYQVRGENVEKYDAGKLLLIMEPRSRHADTRVLSLLRSVACRVGFRVEYGRYASAPPA